MIVLSEAPAYTSVTPTALEIIARRRATRVKRFFGAAFTSAGQFVYKEDDAWTEMVFWYNTQSANPSVLYAITYDGATVYDGPLSRSIASGQPVPTDTPYPPAPQPTPIPPVTGQLPRPAPIATAVMSKRPGWVTPVIAVGSGLAALLIVGLIFKGRR